MSRIAYDRNAATIERLAKEILVQMGYYKRNSAQGADDRLRVGYGAYREARKLVTVMEQAQRRYEREREA